MPGALAPGICLLTRAAFQRASAWVSAGGKGKAGRKLSYTATVQGNGNLLVGKAYTATLDLQPGDEFEIKLGKKQIRLVPVGGSDEEE
jgi:hypothetical protein